jgi:hypothetical protein
VSADPLAGHHFSGHFFIQTRGNHEGIIKPNPGGVKGEWEAGRGAFSSDGNAVRNPEPPGFRIVGSSDRFMHRGKKPGVFVGDRKTPSAGPVETRRAKGLQPPTAW